MKTIVRFYRVKACFYVIKFLLLICVSPQLNAQPIQPRDWGPEQATGAPDTIGWGDRITAWASRTEDEQDEWLELEFSSAVVPSAVRIVENYNPGAISAISVFNNDKKEVEVWRGQDPASPSLRRAVSLIPLSTGIQTKRVRIYLASKSVEGWNEIDAAGIHDASGNLQWAVEARASSTYADGISPVLSAKTDAAKPLSSIPSLAKTPADELLKKYISHKASGNHEAMQLVAEEILRLQHVEGPGKTTWIVVLETSNWDESMAQEEYTFGGMLKAVFDHFKEIEIRHRFFSTGREFIQFCKEASLLDGEIVVVIAAHGSTTGIAGSMGDIGIRDLAKGLLQIRHLRTVHFSSCSIMSGGIPHSLNRSLSARSQFEGVSGYSKDVDWMGSALNEFIYLELLVNRGLPATEAARVLSQVFSISGDTKPESSPIPALSFKLIEPHTP